VEIEPYDGNSPTVENDMSRYTTTILVPLDDMVEVCRRRRAKYVELRDPRVVFIDRIINEVMASSGRKDYMMFNITIKDGRAISSSSYFI